MPHHDHTSATSTSPTEQAIVIEQSINMKGALL
jgi:hypothetical protein